MVATAPRDAAAQRAADDQDAATVPSEQQLEHRHLPRVAVIGAGIGGATAAYYLNELLDGHVNIHV